MRLSPSGRYVALASEEGDEETTFHVGPTDGPFRTFDADDALFVGEDRLLLLIRQRDDVRLQVWALGSAELVWERQLSGVRSWHLSFDTNANQWDLLGWHPDGHIAGVRGRAGTAVVEEQHWEGADESSDPIAISGPDVLLLTTQYERGFVENSQLWQWALLLRPEPRTESHFSMLRSGGRRELLTSRLDLNCEGTLRDSNGPVCAAFDGTRTRFFAVGRDVRRPTPLALLPGRFFSYGYSGRGWLTGWWSGAPIAVRLETGQALTIGGGTTQLNASDHVLGAISPADNGSKIRIYAVP